jgi:hypothetical protein
VTPIQNAISFVAFCYPPDVDATVRITSVDDPNDPGVIGYEVTEGPPPTTVVHKTGGGNDQLFEQDGASSGTVIAGNGEFVGNDRTPSEPCPPGTVDLKFEGGELTEGTTKSTEVNNGGNAIAPPGQAPPGPGTTPGEVTDEVPSTEAPPENGQPEEEPAETQPDEEQPEEEPTETQPDEEQPEEEPTEEEDEQPEEEDEQTEAPSDDDEQPEEEDEQTEAPSDDDEQPEEEDEQTEAQPEEEAGNGPPEGAADPTQELPPEGEGPTDGDSSDGESSNDDSGNGGDGNAGMIPFLPLMGTLGMTAAVTGLVYRQF